MRDHDLDEDTLREAADEAFTFPSDYGRVDHRLYRTHVPVYSWADRGDDLIAESNFYAMLAALQGAVAHDETGASETRGDDVFDGYASHWLVGSLRQIHVRVYEVDRDGFDPEATDYTPAFREAVGLALALRDYPLLDESDYSEREVKAWNSLFDEALDSAIRRFDDEDDDVEAIKELLLSTHADDMIEVVSRCSYSPDDLDWEAVAEQYRLTREMYFASKR